MALLTVHQVAARLSISWQTVHRLIWTGQLRAERAGVGQRSPFRIDEHDLADYRARRVVLVPDAPAAVEPAPAHFHHQDEDRPDVYDDLFR